MRLVLVAISVFVLSACASDSDTIEDKRMGQTLVCHKQKKTMSVSNADYHRHLDHGDSAGPCAYGQ
ncbi:MAG: hypothetical protein L3J24_08460 [Xanthomonadales bacterium]|nr:hypothetical protein [Xanthomonadales bacterium]